MTTCRHCDRPVKYRKSGLCGAHWNRRDRHGVAVGCKVDGCGGDYFRCGLCRRHRTEQLRGTCEVHGCDEVHKAHGMCATHYQQWRRRPRHRFNGDCQGCGGPAEVLDGIPCRWCRECFYVACEEIRAAKAERGRRAGLASARAAA